jgi:tellurite resistance protein TerC
MLPLWIGTLALVAGLIVLDLFVFNKNAHEIKFREAVRLSLFWIAVALAFNAFIYFYLGREAGLQFLAGYVIEESLSVDNLFVFLMIFSYFKVPSMYQHKILYWGIVGALVMRALFILMGVALIQRFSWMTLVFGAFLVFTAIRMLFGGDNQADPANNLVLKWLKKFIPITTDHGGGRFFVRERDRWVATPLFLVLVVVETTDVVFAVDSIPAVLGVSKDPFIVFSSNMFAILGLRALYFALAGVMGLFHYLKYGLSAVLCFVGVKMLLERVVHIPILLSLGVVGVLLGSSIVASLLFPAKKAV